MLRALIVEDDALVARALGRSLSRFLDVVDGVGDVETAVQRLELDGVDVVITDYDLGRGPTGVDLVRIIKTRWPSIAVFIVSGSLDDVMKRRAIEDGVDGCFCKPADVELLAREIHRACARELPAARSRG